jgi:ABC-type dipeptide/oligopeptide/nickel transport system permease component
MRHLAPRLVQILPTMLGALVLVFLVMRVLPGDPAIALLGNAATPDAVAALRRDLGVDRPLPEQFVAYLSGVFRLDLGQSLALRAPVTQLVLDAVPHTLHLTLGGTLVAAAIGVPLGTAAALRRGTWLDYAASVGALLGVSVPVLCGASSCC